MKRLLLTSATILTALTVSQAHAVLQISISSGTSILSCVDNGACDKDLSVRTIELGNSLVGTIQISGNVSMSTGTPSNPDLFDTLSTSNLSIKNTSTLPALFSMAVSDTNFQGHIDSFSMSSSGTWLNAIGSTIINSFFVDPTNQQGAATSGNTPGTLLAQFTKVAATITDSFSNDASGAFVVDGPFSMTLSTNASIRGRGTLLSSGQTELLFDPQPLLIAAPEPFTMTLLGTGLLGLGMTRMRRR